MSSIWNICLKDLIKSFFCYLVRVGTRCIWFFPIFVGLDPCAVANLLELFEVDYIGCRVLISFPVGRNLIFDSAHESIKKSISRSSD